MITRCRVRCADQSLHLAVRTADLTVLKPPLVYGQTKFLKTSEITTGKIVSGESNCKEDIVKREATRIGFDLVGITDAARADGFPAFSDWLDADYHGEMKYLERRKPAYEHPRGVMPTATSIIVLGLNYKTEAPVAPGPKTARVSRYAWGSIDYHDIIRAKLKELAHVVHREFPDCQTRGLVDTAPLLERDFARRAGLGWFGKNTMLINKWKGSYFFLAGLVTDVVLKPDERHNTTHCGTCTRCLEACPTDAFVEPYVLDARRCISYLTIELRDRPIPVDLRKGMQDWMFGCDVCQDVCPWNRKAPSTGAVEFQPAPKMNPVDPVEVLRLSEQEFNERFKSTPLDRPGRVGLIRNAAIVVGNAQQHSAEPALTKLLEDPEPIIRGAVVWALSKLNTPTAVAALHQQRTRETDADVIREFEIALG